jgi:hypothetical protein
MENLKVGKRREAGGDSQGRQGEGGRHDHTRANSDRKSHCRIIQKLLNEYQMTNDK